MTACIRQRHVFHSQSPDPRGRPSCCCALTLSTARTRRYGCGLLKSACAQRPGHAASCSHLLAAISWRSPVTSIVGHGRIHRPKPGASESSPVTSIVSLAYIHTYIPRCQRPLADCDNSACAHEGCTAVQFCGVTGHTVLTNSGASMHLMQHDVTR